GRQVPDRAAATEGAFPFTLMHGDLAPEHVLCSDAGLVTGVIEPRIRQVRGEGAYRSRTGVPGFADLCLTTRPRRRAGDMVSGTGSASFPVRPRTRRRFASRAIRRQTT